MAVRLQTHLKQVLTVILLVNLAQFALAAPKCAYIFRDQKEQLLLDSFYTGAKSFAPVTQLASRINALPAGPKQKWFTAIGKVYREVPKKDPNPMSGWHIGGRRLLDHLLMLTKGEQQQFEQDFVEVQSGQGAYERFMQRQARLFKLQYSAIDVVTLVRFIQSELVRLQIESKRSYPLEIRLSGSFINGKADLLKSDIDVAVNEPKLLREFPEWTQIINDFFAATGRDSNLKIEGSIEAPSFYGRINPIVLIVRSDSIEVAVFASGTPGTSTAGEIIPSAAKVYPY